MAEGPGQPCWAQVLSCDRPQGWVPILPGHWGQRDTPTGMSRVQPGTRKSRPLRWRPNPWRWSPRTWSSESPEQAS